MDGAAIDLDVYVPAPLFTAVFVLASAALALWVDLRAARVRPGSPGRCLAHAALALLVLDLAVAAASAAAATGDPGRRLLLLLCLVLPAFVYLFLAAVWLVRALAELARTYA